MRDRMFTFDWVDLTTPDLDASRAFYRAVLGWAFERSETPMGVYEIAMAGGHQAAGLMASGSDSDGPPSWTVYVRVASITETCATAVNLDGNVLAGPFEIPGGAQVAVLADPAGAVFAVIEGGPEPRSDEPPLRRDASGAVGWCELDTRDPHVALSFYDAVFGWQSTIDEATGYTTLHLGGVDTGGMLPLPAEAPADATSTWLVFFRTADVEATVIAAVAAGGGVVKPPTTVANLTFAILTDPASAVFGVMSGS